MMETFDKFVADNKAEMLDGIVDIAVGLILVATLGLAAWQLLGNGNYTGIDSTTKTLVQTVIGVVAAISVVLFFLRRVKGKGKR